MNYYLREATLKDFDFIFKLNKQGFKSYVEKYSGAWNDEERKIKYKEDLEKNLEHKRIIVKADKPIGIYASHITTDGDLWINTIVLLDQYQNKGIGTEILKEIIKENNNKRIILQVFKNNPAIKFYERLGFTKYNETETHYQMEIK